MMEPQISLGPDNRYECCRPQKGVAGNTRIERHCSALNPLWLLLTLELFCGARVARPGAKAPLLLSNSSLLAPE